MQRRSAERVRGNYSERVSGAHPFLKLAVLGKNGRLVYADFLPFLDFIDSRKR